MPSSFNLLRVRLRVRPPVRSVRRVVPESTGSTGGVSAVFGGGTSRGQIHLCFGGLRGIAEREEGHVLLPPARGCCTSLTFRHGQNPLRGDKQRWLLKAHPTSQRLRVSRRGGSSALFTGEICDCPFWFARFTVSLQRKPNMLSDLADAMGGLAEGLSVRKTATNCSKQRDAADATTALMSSSNIKQLTRSSSPPT